MACLQGFQPCSWSNVVSGMNRRWERSWKVDGWWAPKRVLVEAVTLHPALQYHSTSAQGMTRQRPERHRSADKKLFASWTWVPFKHAQKQTENLENKQPPCYTLISIKINIIIIAYISLYDSYSDVKYSSRCKSLIAYLRSMICLSLHRWRITMCSFHLQHWNG